MDLANTLVGAISAVAALVTVWLAYLALGKAKETVDEARQARLEAERAAKDAAHERRAAAEDRHQAALDRREAAADRRDEAYDRERRRLEHVGQVVEDVFWAGYRETNSSLANAAGPWMFQRNLLRHALIGLHDRLPAAAEILNCTSGTQAVGPASNARRQVERALSELHDQQQDQDDTRT